MSDNVDYSLMLERLKHSFWNDKFVKELLSSILPKNFYEFVYEINKPCLRTYNEGAYFLIISLLQLGIGQKENRFIFNKFEYVNYGKYILTIYNNYFKIIIKSTDSKFKELNLDFYRQDNNNHFLRLYTGHSANAWADFIHFYIDLIWDNYNNDNYKEYSIGYDRYSLSAKLGYFVHTQDSYAFWIPERHEYTLTLEEFNYFHNKYVLHKA